MNARSRAAWFAVLAVAVAVTLLAACDDGGDGSDAVPTIEQLSEGESLGSFERLPGGTAVATETRTLLTVFCEDETLIVRTSMETLTASMPCERILPASVLEGFIGKEVALSYADSRLIVTSESAGTLELPSSEPSIEAPDAP